MQSYMQHPDSYFPPATQSYAYASMPATGFRAQNIDDIVYRYSSELDRGTPSIGIYAQDGLWDEEDVSTASIPVPESGQAPTVQRKDLSLKGRSRSGTITTVAHKEEKSGGIWGWAKKSQGSPEISMHRSPEVSKASPKESEIKRGLKKEKSRSRLRGKGRRGELNVTVLGDPNESFESPPPVPSTPASFLTNPSPAFSGSPFLSPISYPSRLSGAPEDSPHTTTSSSNKSSWKRGMEKIFRSKSSAALRDAFTGQENQRPPLPDAPTILQNLPQPIKTNNPLGKPFSSSTPPMPLATCRRDNVSSYYGSDLLSPLTARSESFYMPSHPSLPHDPFASSLDLSSNQMPISSTPLCSPKLGSPMQSSRPRLAKKSPSLRDLRSLLPRPSKPALSTAKSLANVREEKVPISAPPEKTEFFSSNTLKKRMSSVMGLSTWARNEENLSPAPTSEPHFTSMPMESPPLLPPNPPYFPTSSTLSFRSASSSASEPSELSSSSGIDSAPGFTQTINTPLSAPSPLLTAGPTTPLPLPQSSSTPQLGATTTIHRSASGAVLLPRSRSTSMSLKAPPTSSSFFDLYEQLGIWPTPEKNKQGAGNIAAKEEQEDGQDSSLILDSDTTDASIRPQFNESPSTIFSSSSWDATISAFPMIEAQSSWRLDFGAPRVGDAEISENLRQSPIIDDAASEVISSMTMAASSSGEVRNDTTSSQAVASGNSGEAARPSRNTAAPAGRSGSIGMSREDSGSGGSSRNSSRDRRPREARRQYHEEGGWFERGMSSGSSSESDEGKDDLDDVPLSKLHPQALTAQQEARKRRDARRAEKAKSRARQVNPNIAGRNPGAECNWDGEGGVPPDVLTRKLQKLLMSRAAGIAGYPWESNTALGPGTRGQTEPLPLSRPQPPLRPQRSTTGPDNTMTVIDRKGAKEQEGHSATRPGSSGRSQHQTPQMPPSLSPLLPFTNLQPSPVINDRPTSPASYPTQRQSSLRRGDQPGQSSSSLRSGSSRHNSNATSSSHGHTRLPPVPAPLPSTARVTDVARSNTSATQRSVSWRQRSRALSTAASTHRPVADENTHVRSTTEPVPPRDRTALLVNALVGALNGKRLVLEIHPETTARDVLLAAHQLGDLTDLTGGISWVVVEIFAELGCERQVREYEPLQSIVRGWDRLARCNCLLFRQSNRAIPTLVTAIPTTAPFLGSLVQCETKKGKWTKRWLETRGGQIFLAKNEKNKDEIQINSSFHDVFTMTRPYGSPKPFVFVIKRMEASSFFENPEDYSYVFSSDEPTGWKLLAAIYDAKSYTLPQTRPQPLASGDDMAMQRRSTTKAPEGGPLVSLEKEKEVEKSAFTGKGLLKV